MGPGLRGGVGGGPQSRACNPRGGGAAGTPAAKGAGSGIPGAGGKGDPDCRLPRGRVRRPFLAASRALLHLHGRPRWPRRVPQPERPAGLRSVLLLWRRPRGRPSSPGRSPLRRRTPGAAAAACPSPAAVWESFGVSLVSPPDIWSRPSGIGSVFLSSGSYPAGVVRRKRFGARRPRSLKNK